MRMRVALLVVVLPLPSCGGNPAGPSAGVGSLDSLVSVLQQQGATAVRGDLMPANAYPLSVRARRVAVNGVDTQVFEYPSSDDASRDAALISADGSAIGRTQIDWIDAPHFYRSGRILVIFVGRDPAVMQPLEVVLGKPFAQR